MYAYKDALELSGLAGRVYSLLAVLHGVGELGAQKLALEVTGRESRGPDVTLLGSGDFTHNEKKVSLRGVDIEVPGEGLSLVKGLTFELEAMKGDGTGTEGGAEREMEEKEREEVEEDDFEPVTESGESVSRGEVSLTGAGSADASDVSGNVSEGRSRAGSGRKGERVEEDVRMHPGEHLLITGPNGVGKTAIARVISGLWPVLPLRREGDTSQGSVKLGEGILERPERGVRGVLVVPQRAYMVVGSLIDQ